MGRATITIEGAAGRDAELRFLPTGKAVANTSIAVTPQRKDADGNWHDLPTMWFTVTWWGKRAEAAVEAIRRGAIVTVTGALSMHEYERRDGSSGVEYRIDPVEAWGVQPRLPQPVGARSGGGDDPWAPEPPADEPPF